MKRAFDLLSFLQANSERITIRGRAAKTARLDDAELLKADSIDLSDLDLKVVPSELIQLRSLKRLILSRNKVHDFSALKGLSQIEALGLNMMELKELPSEVQFFQNLRELYCSRNLLRELPSWLANNAKLQILNARNNSLSTWPDCIAQLKNLRELDLSENFLSEIPPSIERLRKLRNLYVSGNQLKLVPSTLGRLSKLRSLALSVNRLRTLPHELCALSLADLWIYDNPLQVPPIAVAVQGIEKIRQYFGAHSSNSSVKKSVFISYAREDAVIARKLHRRLLKSGFEPWLDEESLLPGQDWELYLQEAIRASNFFIAILSSQSVNKTGYVQKEMRRALELLDLRPANESYVIPVRLDNCRSLHPRLSQIQWVDLFPSFERGLQKLLVSLQGRQPASKGS